MKLSGARDYRPEEVFTEPRVAAKVTTVLEDREVRRLGRQIASTYFPFLCHGFPRRRKTKGNWLPPHLYTGTLARRWGADDSTWINHKGKLWATNKCNEVRDWKRTNRNEQERGSQPIHNWALLCLPHTGSESPRWTRQGLLSSLAQPAPWHLPLSSLSTTGVNQGWYFEGQHGYFSVTFEYY